jgi:hypothetical protein
MWNYFATHKLLSREPDRVPCHGQTISENVSSYRCNGDGSIRIVDIADIGHINNVRDVGHVTDIRDV